MNKILKNRPTRKLPPPEVIYRDHWWDELSQEEIAQKYGVRQGTVANYMKKHEIPRRRVGRWNSGQCVICGITSCRVKTSGRHKLYWTTSKYCLLHHVQKRREYQRNYKRDHLIRNRVKPYRPKMKMRKRQVFETSWERNSDL